MNRCHPTVWRRKAVPSSDSNETRMGHEDAVLRVVAYHRNDCDIAVLRTPRQKNDDVRTSIIPAVQTAPRGHLVSGPLDALPVEILVQIIQNLDLKSLLRARQVNGRSREVVSSLRQYKLMTAHGLDTLGILLRTRLACYFTLADFYRTLCIEKCHYCNNFGGFVYLPQLRRCCFQCLDVTNNALTYTLTFWNQHRQSSPEMLAHARVFEIPSGAYDEQGHEHKAGTKMISIEQATLAHVGWKETPGSASAMVEEEPNFLAGCRLVFYDENSGTVEAGLACAGCQLMQDERVARGLRSILVWGSGPEEVLYTRHGFMKHFGYCTYANRLWESSENGTVEPPELPEAVKRRRVDHGWSTRLAMG